jgi:hypothetical protein
MSIRTGRLPRAGRRSAVLVFLSACVLFGLALAGPALAADGVPVITTPLSSPYLGESQPSISGDFLAYAVSDTVLGSDDAVIALKYLGDDSAPWTIARPSGFKDATPQILVQGGDITVVWARLRLEDPWDSHLWIWKGTYDGVVAGFVPVDDTYPQELVTGPLDASPLPSQSAPALGLATVGGEQHAIVAWEDTRDNGYSAPLIYFMDLTNETTWDPASAGSPADPTDIWARGQRSPAVGLGGIYWLDERWSWWDSGNLTDTAVWRDNLATGDTGAFFTDSNHANDNGADSWPQVTSNGAMWLRSGPYGAASVRMPFIKPAGSAGHTVGPIAQPLSPAAYTKAGASSTGLAIAGKHGNSAAAADWDIFFFDATAGVQIPVCDRHIPAYDTDADYFKNNQFSPAIGNAFFAYRVVWVDQRDSAAEDTPDARLYEAFVPTVRWALRPTTILNLTNLRAAVTVLPDFSGQPVYLQRLARSVSKGAVIYKPFRGSLAKATMVQGPSANESSSVATLKWKPTVKGTYYLRVWFPGAAKYGYDGATVATGKMVVVPHVGNASKVFKLVVK